MYIKFI